jgi:hypothetical protein
LPSKLDDCTWHAAGKAVTHDVAATVPPHPVTVLTANRDVGVETEVVVQIGMFCCRHVNTFWPVRDDNALPIVKQTAPAPDPKMPSVD